MTARAALPVIGIHSRPILWFLPQDAKARQARKEWEKWAPGWRPGDPAVVELEIA